MISADSKDLEDDPKAMGQMMRKMGKEMGEDLPPEFDDVVDRTRIRSKSRRDRIRVAGSGKHGLNG